MFWGSEQLDFFESILFLALGQSVEVIETQFLSGGDINTAAQVFSSEGVFFVKWNHSDQLDMFETEVQGLEQLRQTDALTIPKVVGFGQHLSKSYLILEYIDPDPAQPTYWEQLGQSLALIHSHTQARFGFAHDNYIGSLPQQNTLTTNGIDFFFDHRLLPMAGLALYKDLMPKTTYDRLLRLRDQLPNLLPNERPALLHGDLWSGNVLVDANGGPSSD